MIMIKNFIEKFLGRQDKDVNILQDIKDILIRNKDKEHRLKIEISWKGITVYLEYDPDKDFEEKCIIPIRYETLEEFAYIPDNEYRDKYNPNDYGMDLKEIILIKEIMEYLERHSSEINELCSGYDWEDRTIKNAGGDSVLDEQAIDYEETYRNG